MKYPKTATRRAGQVALLLLLPLLSQAAELTVAGIGNFHQVNENLYRGAQPTEEGLKGLAKLGVKTVIDLRRDGERWTDEARIVKEAGMKYVMVPMKGLSSPSDADVAKVLAIFNDSSAGPVFVHCKRGADRTGTVVACYRITHDRWDNKKALAEARSLGMAWIERAMQGYVKSYAPDTNAAPVIVAAPAMAQ